MFVGWVFVRVLMGIVSRATAVVAPEERKSGRERERGKNGEMEKNVSAPC